VTGVEIDSRRVSPGDLFVAVSGGEAYVDDALAHGAAATLVPDDDFAALAAIGSAVRANVAIALGDAARSGHQKGEGKVGGRIGQDARRVSDGNAAGRAGRHIDVVEADREVGDDFEAGTRPIQELIVNALGKQGQDAVATLDGPKELVSRRLHLLLPDTRVAGFENRPEAVIGDRPRDEDPRPPVCRAAHGHAEPAPARADAAAGTEPPPAVPPRAATSGSTMSRMRSSASARFSREFA
jgi:hypothetical protein